jgi:major membrane immunogen (membrane-anchored lipoprotein)
MGTQSVNALGKEFFMKALVAIAKFDGFDEDNDPHGEHDFGSVEVEGIAAWFKFDYYDLDMQFGSEDPSDASKTRRVMTIMLPEDY